MYKIGAAVPDTRHVLRIVWYTRYLGFMAGKKNWPKVGFVTDGMRTGG